MDNCVFCRIVSGAIPAERVYEDEFVLAIRDIHPQAPVHLLLMPKRHLASVLELGEADAALLGRIAAAAIQLANREGVAERGFRLLTNVGRDGGQTVPLRPCTFTWLAGGPWGGRRGRGQGARQDS